MKIKDKYIYKYSAVNIKASTANRFRKFSKKVSKSHTDTISLIIDFFEWHGFLPNERFEKSMLQELLKNRKRMEAMIAIIRDIEINQTKPTANMLLALFEEDQKKPQPTLIEKKYANKKPVDKRKEITSVSKVKYDDLKDKMKELKKSHKRLLDKLHISKTSFGKASIKIELEVDELSRLKQALKKS